MKIKFSKITKYNNYEINLPTRATKHSAGYDFSVAEQTVIKPHETVLVPTGIRACFHHSLVLLIFPRSSLYLKKKLSLVNGVGVIDSDYYYCENEGHIMFPLLNNSDSEVVLEPGERVCQGIFIKYTKIPNEGKISTKRIGGFGSSD